MLYKLLITISKNLMGTLMALMHKIIVNAKIRDLEQQIVLAESQLNLSIKNLGVQKMKVYFNFCFL